MADYIIEAVALIEEQQKKTKERSAQWMVGEQLKDICRMEPASAELLARDLKSENMSIIEAEKKIKAFADKHIVDKSSCVAPIEADRILREFYGLPEAGNTPASTPATAKAANAPGVMSLDLEDLLS